MKLKRRDQRADSTDKSICGSSNPSLISRTNLRWLTAIFSSGSRSPYSTYVHIPTYKHAHLYVIKIIKTSFIEKREIQRAQKIYAELGVVTQTPGIPVLGSSKQALC